MNKLLTWESLVTLRESNADNNWWTSTGEFKLVEVGGLPWKLSLHSGSVETPQQGFVLVDIEDVPSKFAERLQSSIAKADLVMHEMVTPSGVVGFISSWGYDEPRKPALLEYVHFYQDSTDSSRELAYLSTQCIYMVDNPNADELSCAIEIAEGLFQTAAYASEVLLFASADTPGTSNMPWTRATAYPGLLPSLMPKPWMRVVQDEPAVAFTALDEPPASIMSGIVCYFGFTLDSDLTDSQLDEYVFKICGAVQVIADAFEQSEISTSAVPSLDQLFKAALSQRASSQASKQSSRLRAVSSSTMA